MSLPPDYRKLAEKVVDRAQVVSEKTAAKLEITRLREAEKQKRDKIIQAAKFDRDIDDLMNPQKWIDRSEKGSTCIFVKGGPDSPTDKPFDASGGPSNITMSRCSHWGSSVAKFNARYPGFQFTYTPCELHRNKYLSVCTLSICAKPVSRTLATVPTSTPTPAVAVPTVLSFLHRRFSAAQSHFE